jgi:ribosomal-protein-alanine N-acetyltransferase
MSAEAGAFRTRKMTLADVEGVSRVEQASFPTPWSKQAFYNELVNNHFAYYMVVEDNQLIVAYCGMWVIMDEAHITNIAVLPEYRGNKIGETLLRMMMVKAKMDGAQRMTLEVRPSNQVALRLYTKLGFEATGVRPNYYSDNKEDAIIMWVELNERAHLE